MVFLFFGFRVCVFVFWIHGDWGLGFLIWGLVLVLCLRFRVFGFSVYVFCLSFLFLYFESSGLSGFWIWGLGYHASLFRVFDFLLASSPRTAPALRTIHPLPSLVAGNDIKAEGATALSIALPHLTALQTLYLSGKLHDDVFQSDGR